MTRVLVATHRGQGFRKSDFANATDGEMVLPASPCDGGTIDDACGCRRAWTGTDSRMATTTAEVKDLPLTPAQVEETILGAERAAWRGLMDAADVLVETRSQIRSLLRLAGRAPVGTVFEIRGTQVRSRLPEEVAAVG